MTLSLSEISVVLEQKISKSYRSYIFILIVKRGNKNRSYSIMRNYNRMSINCELNTKSIKWDDSSI
jgi:predicted DNA-binding helix-hairpin-helix protein